MTRRILVIDDEASILMIVKMTLEVTAGWEVITAESAAVGFEMAEREPLDAILLDLVMPELDGVAVFERLRSSSHTYHTPVIFLTARARQVQRQSLENMGSAGVITKPFEPTAIANQIKAMLGWTY